MNSLLISPRRKASDDNMIPLINIVFLLLIFFMIAGQIRNLVPELELPTGDSARKAIESEFKLALTRNKLLYLNGETIELASLAAQLAEVSHITLVVDRRLTAKDLDAVLNILRETSSASVNLLLESTTQPAGITR